MDRKEACNTFEKSNGISGTGCLKHIARKLKWVIQWNIVREMIQWLARDSQRWGQRWEMEGVIIECDVRECLGKNKAGNMTA